MKTLLQSISQKDEFRSRHIGPRPGDVKKMLDTIGKKSLDEMVEATVPASIRMADELDLENGLTEQEALTKLKEIASENKVFRSWIGMGYSGTHTPSVIKRNILENPGWYTQYTPYQAEISQGRLEALLNFQTMTSDLTGLEVSNASLLDEGTAAAEAMHLCNASKNRDGTKAFFASEECHPQTLEVLKTRANAMGISLIVGDHRKFDFQNAIFGMLLQYPTTYGEVEDYTDLIAKIHDAGAMAVVAADILSLTVLKSPGEMGADIAVGSTQRFGVPLGFGGPHAAYFSTKDQFKRLVPGRIIGVSKDRDGKKAYRLALQTREQHIRREKATSNICTAQALLASMASSYAVFHGPAGLRKIAERVMGLTTLLGEALKNGGKSIRSKTYFDTLVVELDKAEQKKVIDAALKKEVNLRSFDDGSLGVAFDETTTYEDVKNVASFFGVDADWKSLESEAGDFPKGLERKSEYLTHDVFNSYHSETEMMRYLKKLENKDLSLTLSMIPLGSCTMKLNAASELYPVSWPEFSSIHPFAPSDQTKGYRMLFTQLEDQLAEITGYDKVSLQPNSGAQGEFAGLLAIRAYHESKGDFARNICLIPSSAHGTNPASAAMVGMKVVVVKCDKNGNVDLEDLRAKAEKHAEHLSALLVTYPSTHGVFEEEIREICDVVHQHGGQVYMDGANLNAQLGLSQPGKFGPDVSHLNLHKTFAIPHGGGGPGVGPIAVRSHLAPFLPGHAEVELDHKRTDGAVSAAPWGSASILPISWMYIKMMGREGLLETSHTAILSANYIAKRLEGNYDVLFKGSKGMVAHECIVDLRPLKASAKIEVDDIAKRLIDYGFHAPTVSFPVPGTIMIEPTESESLEEVDRFCDAMISIREEIKKIESGAMSTDVNVLKNAPHTAEMLMREAWDFPYTREEAAYPVVSLRAHKFWSPVARVDNAFGDRNFICSCPPIEDYE